MGTRAQFDLAAAVATWRHVLARSSRLDQDDVDELEAHLQDEIDALVAEGRTEKDAFAEARRRVGDYALIEDGYRKAYRQRKRQTRTLRERMIAAVAMLKNYTTIAFRGVRSHPGYAFINVAGLSAAVACSVLIALFIREELSFDHYHENADRIVRVVDRIETGDLRRDFAAVPAPMGPALVEAFGEVERAVRFSVWEEPWVRYGEHAFKESNLFFADASVFEVFTFPLAEGNPSTALVEPQTVVLSETGARKLFGTASPIGETLLLGTGSPYVVTGVMRDMPHASHFRTDILASFATLDDESSVRSWMRHDFYTYLLLRDQAAAATLADKLPAFVKQRMAPQLAEEIRSIDVSLQPLTDIHLHSHRYEEISANGNPTTLTMLGAIGLFILLIACANYTNLATARATRRAREIGMRITLGASRSQLALQFLGEAVVTSTIAVAAGIGITLAFLDTFNTVAGSSVASSALFSPVALVPLALLALLLGLLSGVYPAIYLSRIKPTSVLDGRRAGTRAAWVRKGLVMLQFSVSIALLIGTGTVLQQIRFLETKDLGFDKEQVAVVRMYDEQQSVYETIRAELLEHPAIASVSRTSGVPGMDAGIGGTSVTPEGATDPRSIRMIWVDFGFTETFGIDMVAGRSFDENRPTDASDAFVVNETAARQLGWTDPSEAVGKRLTWGDRKSGMIAGVMEDFHVLSLRDAIEPMVVHVWPQWTGLALVRLEPGRAAEALPFIRQRWDARNPDVPFDAFFLDENFDRMYRGEARFGRLLGFFSALAIFIACLGLVGLAAFTVAQRTKEIGIRKVLGASVTRLTLYLSGQFTRLVLVALAAATPIAYIAMMAWLESFAYRTPLAWWIFALAGATALVVAFLAVGVQTIRAASANPVEALRRS